MAFGVLGDLLNAKSLAAGRQVMEIEYIPRDEIKKNSRNGYSIGNIEELAQDIKSSGIAQPLEVVEDEGGGYRLLTGERRLTAVDLLIQRGEWEGEIPCVVKELDDYDLPLPLDLKEDYAIMRTNRCNRVLTDADIMYESERWEKIVDTLRKAGYDYFSAGKDANGTEAMQPIRGRRTREVVAEMLNVSTGQLAKYENVRKHGAEELRQAVREERIDIAAADEAAKLPMEKQEKLMERATKQEKVTTQDIREFCKSEGIKKEPEREEILAFYRESGIQNEKRENWKKWLVGHSGKVRCGTDFEVHYECSKHGIRLNGSDRMSLARFVKLMGKYVDEDGYHQNTYQDTAQESVGNFTGKCGGCRHDIGGHGDEFCLSCMRAYSDNYESI